MSDPATLTLAGVGAIALKEGVKFLYGQAGEILKRWRDRKEQTRGGDSTSADAELPTIFVGEQRSPRIHFQEIPALEGRLRALYRELAEYATEVSPVSTEDPDLLSKIDELRKVIERIYRQRLTFEGEQRRPADLAVFGRVELGTIGGEAIGVDAEGKGASEIRGEVVGEELKPGASAIGAKWKA